MCADLHNSASLDHVGNQLPLLLVCLQPLEEKVVFFLRPTTSYDR
jgi:hypothetical protein